MWGHPDHVVMCSVGQSERPSIVLLVELGLFKVQLIQSEADLSTFLQSLVVLRELQNKQQRLVLNVPRSTDLMTKS